MMKAGIPIGDDMSTTLPSPEATLELLRTRRSIRRYRPDPVPDEMLAQILEAGRWAPSASNRQPWRFVVVRDRAVLKEVGQHAAYYFLRWAHVAEAPLLIVLCGTAKNRIYQQFLHEDSGLAGGQMMLQAKALGLGTCWVGGVDRKAIADILRLPDGIRVVGLLTVGFPAEDPPPTPRKPLEEIVHYDVYGRHSEGDEVKPGRLSAGPLSILLRRLRFPFRV
jgi:nitroreductase